MKSSYWLLFLSHLSFLALKQSFYNFRTENSACGIQIFWVSPMAQMDTRIFPEPSKFDPSRFENQASVPPYSFVAFGGGPRICPGYEFARIKTLVAIHYLITHFTWKLCADNSFIRDPCQYQRKDYQSNLCQETILALEYC